MVGDGMDATGRPGLLGGDDGRPGLLGGDDGTRIAGTCGSVVLVGVGESIFISCGCTIVGPKVLCVGVL